MEIDERVDSLYKRAKKQPDNAELQEAVEVVKFLRRSQGSLQGWNHRYREEKSELTEKIETLKGELDSLNAEMFTLGQEISRRTAEKERAIAELKNIEREVKMAAHNVRETKSIFGKFSIVWTLLRSLFLDEDWEDFGAIDNRLPTDRDRPQMESDRANINRSLLDK
jgi:chromosome segregation ATPase